MARIIETKKVSVNDVQFQQKYYPREKPHTATIEQYVDNLQAGDQFPPIELDADGLVLLDGYHRWKAHIEAGLTEIEANIIALNGTSRRFYAATRNVLFGDRLSKAEKKDIAREMAEGGMKQSEIADGLKVSPATVSSWVSDITKRQQRSRDARIWWLHTLGWTKEEIADKVGVSPTTAQDVRSENPELKKVTTDQSARGRTIAQIAEAEGIPDTLAEVLLLDGKSDAERMKHLSVGIQPYDVWSFSGCDPRFGAEYPGRVPGQLLLHLLYFYTEPGQLVIDPMVGSGTTIDACAYMGRKVYGYDAHPTQERDDVIEHDMAQGWPERTAQSQFIFWDPPYFKKKDDGYGDKSISRLDKQAYMAFFEQTAHTIPDKFAGRLGFLCSDYNEEDNIGANIFFWDYVKVFADAGWGIERRIQIPLTTQQVHPDIVNRFRAERRLARLGRDIVILRRG